MQLYNVHVHVLLISAQLLSDLLITETLQNLLMTTIRFLRSSLFANVVEFPANRRLGRTYEYMMAFKRCCRHSRSMSRFRALRPTVTTPVAIRSTRSSFREIISRQIAAILQSKLPEVAKTTRVADDGVTAEAPNLVCKCLSNMQCSHVVYMYMQFI